MKQEDSLREQELSREILDIVEKGFVRRFYLSKIVKKKMRDVIVFYLEEEYFQQREKDKGKVLKCVWGILDIVMMLEQLEKKEVVVELLEVSLERERGGNRQGFEF